jgi:5'-phosphate synthase pdxT subunit
LALQGAFQLHRRHIEALGADSIEVIDVKALNAIDGLILPGGESGTMLKLLDHLDASHGGGMKERLRAFLNERPSWGICAGAILLARTVRNPEQESFAKIDIEIVRNAYGRQIESAKELVNEYEVSYIRAPQIVNVGPAVEVFSLRVGHPTWVEDGRCMATTFHPETNDHLPSPWHRRLFEKCLKENGQ